MTGKKLKLKQEDKKKKKNREMIPTSMSIKHVICRWL
jgi:hypothetical protein